MDWTLIAVGAVGTLLGGGLIAALLTHRREVAAQNLSGLREHLSAVSKRLTEVEADLTEQREWRRKQEVRYSRLWAYTRALIDYAYRHRRDDAPPLPDMPEGLE